MKQIEIIKKLLLSCECEKCLAYLSDVAQQYDCQDYANAFVRVILIEAVKEINDTVCGFYFDEKDLIQKLFGEEKLDVKEALHLVCERARTAAEMRRDICFEKVKSYIHSHYADLQFSLGAAAQYANISQGCVAKLFVANTGMTPAEYVGRLRVEKGIEYLSQGTSVMKTAELVGFSSEESFIRVFKRYMGDTPGSWKRNNSEIKER